MEQPLSLIVPVYEEKDNFPRLVEDVEQKLALSYTMVVIYDRDEDSTVPVAEELARTRPWLRLVKNRHGPGAVNAIRTGFEEVEEGPALVLMADLSDDLEVVPRMMELYRQGHRIVCASRYMPGGRQIRGGVLKPILSRVAGLSLHHLFGFPTHDATNNFRLYDAGLVNRMGIESQGGFEISLELTAKAHRGGFPIAEVPVTWHGRKAGETQFRLFKWLPGYLRWYWFAIGGKARIRADSEP